MIRLTLKPSPKNFEIIGISFWPPTSPDLNPLDYAISGVLKNKTKQMQVPFKIFVVLRLYY